jgi:hypothetical protein
MKGVMIGRPINGISINGNEYVCDENRLAIVFDDENDAGEFLKTNGYTDKNIEDYGIVFESVDEEDEE